ncbi:MAG TPA: 6-carboxytetrahydropterin synthase, partial [Chloroflexota bacterium]|nr:6-carboxytetrahydropterin synthase [Chloroflexota bacterium]
MLPASEHDAIAPFAMDLTRYHCFEASHRYWRDDWPAAQNLARFGRCTSPFGHGHNYTLAATVRGKVDPTSGMILNLHDLDELLGDVTRPLDHQYLNESVPVFRAGTQPTAEALA